MSVKFYRLHAEDPNGKTGFNELFIRRRSAMRAGKAALKAGLRVWVEEVEL